MKLSHKKNIAVLQIFILLVAAIAFTWMIGSSIEVVSAVDEGDNGGRQNNDALRSLLPSLAPSIVAPFANYGVQSLLGGSQIGATSSVAATTTGATASSTGGLGAGFAEFTPGISSGTASSGSSTSIFWAHFWGWAGPIMGSAAAAYGWVLAFKAFGASGRNVNAMSNFALYAFSAGALAGSILGPGAGSLLGTAILGAGAATGIGAGIALLAMLTYTALSYQTYSQTTFTYISSIWQPVEGGAECEVCNNLEYGCSEYQCRSFGEACELSEFGTKDQSCIWKNPNDRIPPEISALNSVLKSGYNYIPITSNAPTGDVGVKIVYPQNQDGCIPPFTDITLGINTSEPAECKIDLERSLPYEEMLSYMQGSGNVYNHTLLLPSSATASNEALENASWNFDPSREYNFYIKCEDSNGNSNKIDFVMQFCVDDGPDTRAPVIEGTSPIHPSYITYGTSNATVEVYTDEPAECKWDFLDLNYDEMTYNFTDFCSTSLQNYMYPNSYQYGCRTNFTGIHDGQDNRYYIRCKDQPWWQPGDEGGRNANSESTPLTLVGTFPLQIDEVTINGEENGSTIKDSTEVIQIDLAVMTSAGADEGNARCQYSIDNGTTFYDFYNGGSFDYNYINTQSLWLVEDFYFIPIKCYDQGGNVVESSMAFQVKTDNDAPEISRVYYEEGSLKLITNEPAECVYSTDFNSGCNYDFEDGSSLMTVNDVNHFVDWTTDEDLYIKCRDMYGNMPLPQATCSIIARGSEFYSGAD
ncbi:MAG: hypothetical protein KC516_03420 [Nanoarchaeota archaeon]|nr:hypothetical protein [Nanoarchaeota archaeon]